MKISSVVLLVGMVGLALNGTAFPQSRGTFVSVGSMSVDHEGGGSGSGGGYASRGAAGALLPDGQVLMAGGSAGPNSVAELFDPTSLRFQPTHLMNAPYGTATVLENGSVLMTCSGVPNGFDSRTQLHSSPAALYDVSSGTFSATVNMPELLLSGPATLLADGLVLIAGGEQSFDFGNAPTNAALLYDPSKGSFSFTGRMNAARYAHTATLLPNGLVLIAGGTQFNDGFGPSLKSAELYDPSTGRFTPTGDMSVPRAYHTATLLQTGQVLIAGGEDTAPFPHPSQVWRTAELYDPADGKFVATGSMAAARFAHTATLLDNGQVLIAGGGDHSSVFASAELFDPGTGQFVQTASMGNARQFQIAESLGDNHVLIAGGFGAPGRGLPLRSAEVFELQ